MRFRFFVVALAMMTGTLAARATTLAGTNTGTGANGTGYYGQSFTVAGSGSDTSIMFSFLNGTGSGATAYATGTGYLLTSAYTGAPSALTSGTAGVIGTATASAGAYSFGTGTVLTAGTTYYFYETAAIPAGSFDGGSVISGGMGFLTTDNTVGYTPIFGTSTNFTVSGTAVPEISASGAVDGIALLAGGLLIFSGKRRVQQVTAAA